MTVELHHCVQTDAANQKTARDKKKREDEGKNTRIEFLDNMVEDLQTKVSTLETTVTELNTSKAELEVRNAKLEAEIARLKGGTTAPSSFDSNLQSSSENALLDSRNSRFLHACTRSTRSYTPSTALEHPLADPHAADGTEFFGPADLAQAVTGPDALDQDATALFSQHGTGGSFLYDWELQRYFNDSIPVASDVHTASNVPEDLQGMGPERSSENATFSPTMMDRNPLESHSLPQGVSTWSAVPGTVAYQQAYTTPSFAQQWSGSQANSDISVPVCATIGKNENLPNSRAARVTLQNLDKDERLEFETTFDPMRRALLAGRAASRKRRARGNVNQ
ncbi:hypothetical protein IAT40_002801 [Kwoniella sp. CBS 6097]